MPLLQAQVSAPKLHSYTVQAQQSRQSTFIIVDTKKKQVIRSPNRKQKDRMRKSSVRIDVSALNLIQSDLKIQQNEGFQKETSNRITKKHQQMKRRKTQELFHMASSLVKSKTSYTAEGIQARSFFAKQIKERISVEDQNLKQSMISSACHIFVKLPKRQMKSAINNEKCSETKKENVFVESTRKNVAIPRIFSGNTFRIDTIRQLKLKSTC